MGEEEIVVRPVPVQLPGQGTRAASAAVELVSIDAETAESLNAVTVPLPAWAAQDNGLAANALGQVSDVLVLTVTTNQHVLVLGVDIDTGQVRWQVEDQGRAVLAGEVVVTDGKLGLSAGGVTARGWRVSDGQEIWSSPVSSAEYLGPAGPNFMLASGFAEDFTQTARLIATATGSEVTRWDSSGRAWGCWYDGADVVVCSPDANSESGILAFDATTGGMLWSLPDEAGTRLSPKLTGAWHGALYGYTGTGPVVLDGRTGADREVAPGVSPFMVDEFGGFARSSPQAEEMYYVPAVG